MTKRSAAEPTATEPTRLMRCGTLKRESGRHDLTSLELCRGTKILSCVGEVLGFVAAIVVNHSGDVRGFLLVRPQAPFEYRLVSAEVIRAAGDSAITLTLATPEVAELPVYERGR